MLMFCSRLVSISFLVLCRFCVWLSRLVVRVLRMLCCYVCLCRFWFLFGLVSFWVMVKLRVRLMVVLRLSMVSVWLRFLIWWWLVYSGELVMCSMCVFNVMLMVMMLVVVVMFVFGFCVSLMMCKVILGGEGRLW